MRSSDRNAIIRELRHQLYYTNPGPEQEEIRRQLDFWIHYQPSSSAQ